MRRIKLLLQIIKKNPIESKVVQKFPLILKAVNAILNKIKDYEDFKAAKGHFDELQETQDVLAEMLFKHNIQMSPGLRKFIRDCDRLDDEEIREYLFREIKNDRYSLNSNGLGYEKNTITTANNKN
jgi:hypothetical protein